MRVLMVSPYAPARDGIAAYALQEVGALRRAGNDVEVLSPGPSAAHHHLDLRGWRGPAALARRVGSYDTTIVQFHPDVFYPSPATAASHVAVSLALKAALRRARRAELVVHEIDHAIGRRRGAAGRAMASMLRAADTIRVHTQVEAEALSEAFGVPAARIATADHGAHFERRTNVGRVEARNRLGIPADAFSFLAIGFIQPHKGFDRAVRAFAQVGVPGCRLDIVGSVRVEEPAYLDHLDELERLAAATPGVTVHAGFVTDEAFDAWLVAADVVVLPYRHIWSSGVLERAALYERPVIASRVGGLAAQARGDTVLVDDDAQLASAMRAAAARARPATADDPWPHGTADRERVQSEIRARAARERGGLSSGAATGIVRDPVTPLARVAPLALPEPRSLNPVSAAIKRLVRRATAWEVEPIVEQVNRLRTAAIEAAERSRSADR